MRDEGCVFWGMTLMMLGCIGWLFGGALGWWSL